MKIKITKLLIFLIILLPSNGFAFDTVKSFDGKWFVPKAIVDDGHITIGIEPTDLKIHKFKLISTIIHQGEEKASRIEVYEPPFPTSFYKRFKYKDGIMPNFAILKFIIYVDSMPIVIYEFHTNGSGDIIFSFLRWLNQ